MAGAPAACLRVALLSTQKLSQRAARFGAVSEQAKKALRAEKFGIVAEDLKKQKRSERFGLSSSSSDGAAAAAGAAAGSGDDSAKKAARAARFGIDASSASGGAADGAATNGSSIKASVSVTMIVSGCGFVTNVCSCSRLGLDFINAFIVVHRTPSMTQSYRINFYLCPKSDVCC